MFFSGSWISEWLDCRGLPVPLFWGLGTVWRYDQGSDLGLVSCVLAPDFGNTVVMVCLHMKIYVKFWNQICMIFQLNFIQFCEQIIDISIRNSFCVEYIFQSSKFGYIFFWYNYLFKMELVFEFSGFLLEDFIDCD